MGLLSISVSWGLGRDLASLGPARSIQAVKYTFLLQLFIAMSPGFGRISFALFLVQIVQKNVKQRRFL